MIFTSNFKIAGHLPQAVAISLGVPRGWTGRRCGMRRKMLRCPCGARHSIPEGATRIECPRCGRIFGQPKPAPNQTREMERRRRQMEKQGENKL